MKSKKEPAPSKAGADAASSFMAASAGEYLKTLGTVNMPLAGMAELQTHYMQEATELWNQSLQSLQGRPADAAVRAARQRW